MGREESSISSLPLTGLLKVLPAQILAGACRGPPSLHGGGPGSVFVVPHFNFL